MQYPLISEYVRAIQDASDNLGELAHFVPVLDDHGEPYRSSGAFAVVFKMKDEQTGKCYALKCFLEGQEGRADAYRMIADELDCVDSSYVTSVKYLEKEIFVDCSCEEDEFPVLLMDWVEGETMETYLASNYQDEYAMGMLCYRFCKMAAWLRSQPFAHGDIKPDNIMVCPDGTLTLVDYDGMFVPAMKGQKSPTIGTKDFSHPLRTIDDFDETIDDFALASIALSLKAISLKPSLFDEYGAADRLLFSADDYRDLSKSKVMNALQGLMSNEELTTLLSMFLLASAKKNLAMCSFRTFSISKPFYDADELIKQADLLFEKSKDEADHKKASHLYSLADVKGSLYAKACLGYCYCLGKGVVEDSEKGLALIRVSANAGNAKGQNILGVCYASGMGLEQSNEEAIKWYRKSAEQGFERAQCNLGYCYRNGAGIVRNEFEAIKWFFKAARRDYAPAQRAIGDSYFYGKGVSRNFDKAYIWYRKAAAQCDASAQFSLGSYFEHGWNVKQDDNEAVRLYRESATQGYVVAQYALGICYKEGCGVPRNIEEAISYFRMAAKQNYAEAQFELGRCYEQGIGLTQSLEKAMLWFRKSADLGCFQAKNSIRRLTIKPLFREIDALSPKIMDGELENAVADEYGVKYSKDGRRLLKATCLLDGKYLVKKGTVVICNEAFSNCSLSNIVISDSVVCIGEFAFDSCSLLSSIHIPNSVRKIGHAAFFQCYSLVNMVIPNNVTSLGSSAFCDCPSLSRINISCNLTNIGEHMFENCSSLTEFIIPNGVSRICYGAFKGCKSLKNIVIPESVTSISDGVFHGCKSLLSITVPRGVTHIDGNPFGLWHGQLQILSPYFIYDDDILFDRERKNMIAFRKIVKKICNTKRCCKYW